ncbi:MAG: hypothetical protein M3Q15_00825 [Pseudomonadota bacterium]|nr:hypothetical protein [Pseudomonadota bacterium]
MTPVNDATWRNRFILMNVSRIAATVLVLFGLLLWQSDRIVEGGSILGLPIVLFGLVASFLAPKWLARRWRTPPAP